MGLRIPLGNKGHSLSSQMIHISEIADTQPLALQNAEPLLHLIHPGAMRGQKGTGEAGMSRQPGLNAFPFVDTRIIKDEVDVSN
jgi:hypothetical protein